MRKIAAAFSILLAIIFASSIVLAACPVIFNPNGVPGTPRGINVSDVNMADADQILATFPGLNIIRLVVGTYQDPPAYAAFINKMTSRGIVVVLDDHVSSTGRNSGGSDGVIFSGPLLQQELAWDRAVAYAYKDNPYVWNTTNNEPSEQVTDGGPMNPAALSAWQDQQIGAIRGTGNNNPILVEVNGWSDPGMPGGVRYANGYDQSVYLKYHNLMSDVHEYNWITGFSTDINVINSAISATITQTQSIMRDADGVMPIIYGEVGPSCCGSSVGGMLMLQAVQQTGFGYMAWYWAKGSQEEDDLLNPDGTLNAYGREVAADIKRGGGPIGSATTCGPPGIPLPMLPLAIPPFAMLLPTPLPTPIPQTYVPEPAPLAPNLIAPVPDLPVAPIPITPEPNQDNPVPIAAPTPEIAIPPEPEIALPPIDLQPPVNTIYPPPITIPVAPLIGSHVPINPTIQRVVDEVRATTKEYSMINPIGSWLVRMDNSIIAAGDVALQGIAPLLTIPVGIAALLFLGANGVRITQGDPRAINAMWFDIVKLIFIIDLSLNLGDYDYYVRDLIYTSLANALTSAVAQGMVGLANGVQSVAATMDGLWSVSWEWVAKVDNDAGILDFGSVLSAFICEIAICCSLLAMTLVYLLARLLLQVVLVIGPIAITCSMHRQTAPIFERWMGKVIALLFLEVSGILVLVMVLSANKYFMDQINPLLHAVPAAGNGWLGTDASPAPSAANDIEILASMVAWFGMGAFALYSLPAIAYSIGTGVAVSFMPVVMGLAAAGVAVGSAMASGLGAMSGFSLGGGGGEAGLSMSLAREELEGSGFNQLPPPPPPALAGSSETLMIE